MTMNISRWSVLGLAWFMLCGITGCTRWIDVKSPSVDLQETIAHSLPEAERVPLVTNSFHLSRNGASQDPSIDLERRILNSIQETSLFSPLLPLGERTDSLGDKIVSARITVDETIEPHSWLSAFKGIVIGGSMFLLSPFINLEYGYSATVALELERWDGQVTRYESNSSGTVHYKLFAATPVMIDELKGHVTEACLTELTRQLVRDTRLYMASSAPLPDTDIRTVTVKAKRPAGTQPARSFVPVTTATKP
ncbi:MAG: hypothetical protein CV081_05525 [Nitrospira sp. LK265]|nr:hypothetical protein [Nitrospira sp.]NGZ59947.1 hypothetical protein [Nitrospira sp. LK265]